MKATGGEDIGHKLHAQGRCTSQMREEERWWIQGGDRAYKSELLATSSSQRSPPFKALRAWPEGCRMEDGAQTCEPCCRQLPPPRQTRDLCPLSINAHTWILSLSSLFPPLLTTLFVLLYTYVFSHCTLVWGLGQSTDCAAV